jgi:hypothetical protein
MYNLQMTEPTPNAAEDTLRVTSCMPHRLIVNSLLRPTRLLMFSALSREYKRFETKE